MDIRHVSYLMEVAKQMNITKAAESLHLTQPTLSKIIRSVEDELGITLFDRSNKQMRLTDMGSVAIEHFQSILLAVRNLHTSIDDIAQSKFGTITIGLPPVIGSVFFPRVISPYQNLHPNVAFNMVEEGAMKIESLLLDGSLDVGVVVGPVNAEAFHSVPFLRQQLALVVHEEHPLAQRDSVSIAELRDEPFILFTNGFAVRRHVMRECRNAGFEPRIVHASSQWDLMAEMVAARRGVSILPDAICQKIIAPNVRIIALENPVLPWHLDLIWLRDKYISYSARSFIAYMQALTTDTAGSS